MARTDYVPDFRFSWRTLSHYNHPYGDLLWHLFWGVVVGGSIIYSIIVKDFLFLIISFFALIFFFHPFFYEPTELRIVIDKRGVELNNSLYSWEDFDGFELIHNGDRHILVLISKHTFHHGVHLPLEDYVDLENLRLTLRQFLREYANAVTIFDRWYRNIFK
jgi:hypothetical protein